MIASLKSKNRGELSREGIAKRCALLTTPSNEEGFSDHSNWNCVCDCSCWGSGMLASLNDCLTVGPPFLSTVLLCFGIHAFSLSIDIEKALLHVKQHPLDNNFTRFLWPSNLENPDSDIVLLWFHLELPAHPLCLEQCWTFLLYKLQVTSEATPMSTKFCQVSTLKKSF